MVGFCLKSVAMLLAWTGLLMIFTSAGGSLLMLSELLLAVSGSACLLAQARQIIGRMVGGGAREARRQGDLVA